MAVHSKLKCCALSAAYAKMFDFFRIETVLSVKTFSETNIQTNGYATLSWIMQPKFKDFVRLKQL